MTDPVSAIDRLGADVRKALGDGPSAEAQARLRQRILEGEDLAPKSKRSGWGVWVLIPAVAACLVAFVWGGTWLAADAEDAARVVRAVDLGEGGWLSADEEQPVALNFEDGSRVGLRPGGRVRLARLNGRAVGMNLENGAVDLDVQKSGQRTWQIEAGPFRVEVLGTAFVTDWEAERQRLVVTVTRGVVRVSGGTIGVKGLELHAGDRVEADAAAGTTLLARGDGGAEAVSGEPEGDAGLPRESAVEPDPDLDSTPEPGAEGPAESERSRRHAAPRSKRRAAPDSDWEALARARKHGEALARAEAAGFESLTASLDAPQLALLANAARYGRNVRRAKQALRALRDRFPTRAEGRRAAFLLGRIAVEMVGDHREGIHWFNVYLRESPRGPFAGQARGRLMQAQLEVGDRTGARATARAIVSKDPKGTYAAAARKLLDGSSP